MGGSEGPHIDSRGSPSSGLNQLNKNTPSPFPLKKVKKSSICQRKTKKEKMPLFVKKTQNCRIVKYVTS